MARSVAHGRECTPHTIVMQEHAQITPVSTFAERLKEAREAAGFTSQLALAKAVGLSAGAIGNWEAGTRQQPREILALAKALGVSPEWLSTGSRDGGQPTPLAGGLAHPMSHARPIVDLPRFTWEQLMTADMSQPFELVVEDDALTPDIFKGCIARFDPAREPAPGRPVLVRDASGQFHLREYEAGPSGRWRAVARARGFRPLDSESDGLTLVAVMKGYDWP